MRFVLMSLSALFLIVGAAPAAAQSALTVRDTELAVPFGSVKGVLALAGDQIVFISSDSPDASIAIPRGDIRSVNRSDDIVTVTTRNALRDRTGSRDTFRFRLSQPGELVSWYEKAPAAATAAAPAPAASKVLASYQVKHDHRIGHCEGTLVLTTDRIGYESTDEIDDSRQWLLADIKEVKQRGIYRLEVVPFFGDNFNFELAGKGMDSGEFRRLLDRIARARSRP